MNFTPSSHAWQIGHPLRTAWLQRYLHAVQCVSSSISTLRHQKTHRLASAPLGACIERLYSHALSTEPVAGHCLRKRKNIFLRAPRPRPAARPMLLLLPSPEHLTRSCCRRCRPSPASVPRGPSGCAKPWSLEACAIPCGWFGPDRGHSVAGLTHPEPRGSVLGARASNVAEIRADIMG